ncbi:flavin reductase family protein [Streptomyces sp. AP-93]|uniref:flavin reductase family protein n=1 Tax=Streptomyces sp. AP-93 TaxID=2929048 RepID=UPI001FAF7397|nr:flavin reductase family protein [Streptomyces sp. AP-93]MCJ0868384.1 flavin reductase family protein [Streptomyces sp. AP-93]
MERLTGPAAGAVDPAVPVASGIPASGTPVDPAVPVDPALFREVLGAFASGITVVAAVADDGRPAGLACQSFASLSLDPPLVLLCVGKGSSSWPKVRAAGRFGVSILAEDQRAVCEALGRRGEDKFAGVDWELSAHRAVRVTGALATVDCALEEVHEAGDHYLVTARVLELSASDGGSPLLYYRSAYATGAFG